MTKKYELIGHRNGLYRIRALRDFFDVIAGEYGGFVESENNLSHRGTCWLYEDAMAYENSFVSENATVTGRAHMSGKSQAYGYCNIDDNVRMCDNAIACAKSRISGNAVLKNNQIISCGRLIVEADGFTTAQDSRGYTFLAAWKNNEIISVTSGCRIWSSIEQAKNHFLGEYPGGYTSDGDVNECIEILNHLNKIFSVKNK